MPSSLIGVKGIAISQNWATHTPSVDAEYNAKEKLPNRIALVTILVTRLLYLYKPLKYLLTCQNIWLNNFRRSLIGRSLPPRAHKSPVMKDCSSLDSRRLSPSKKPSRRMAFFGNTFGNKGVVYLQTLIKTLTLAEEVSRFCSSKVIYHYP